MQTGGPVQTGALTGLALVAFASNSLLCRLALSDGAVDAATFTTIRLVSGAAMLLLLTAARSRASAFPVTAPWRSACALAAYAIAFSYAYLSLDAATGGLLLFGSVQATIIGVALLRGARAGLAEWVGLALALAGLVYLVAPGLTAPPARGAALMIAAGVSWGVYTIVGRTAGDPLAATSSNFLRAAPLAIAGSLLALAAGAAVSLTPQGAVLALASGALSSALGYVVWYAALAGLGAIRTATVQLPVPVLTAIGGVFLLGESVTVRLMVATVVILGGVAIAVFGTGRLATASAGPR